MFTDEQKKELAKPLHPDNVKPPAPGKYGEYIEGWKVIEEANRIFGFDGWSRETVEMVEVCRYETKIGKAPNLKDGWAIGYRAKVRVTIYSESGLEDIKREGSAVGNGVSVQLYDAVESAVKEAETDAMKRAMMTLGYPFGLALYDKSKANVGIEVEAPASVGAFLNGLRESYNTNSAEAYWKEHWPAVPHEWRPYALEQKEQIKTAHGKVAMLRAG